MTTRYEIEQLPAGRFVCKTRRGKWRVRRCTVHSSGKSRGQWRNTVTVGIYDSLSLALFFGLPYGKGSKLRRRPELEGGRAVQVWA